jgi:hypothetical protein
MFLTEEASKLLRLSPVTTHRLKNRPKKLGEYMRTQIHTGIRYNLTETNQENHSKDSGCIRA